MLRTLIAAAASVLLMLAADCAMIRVEAAEAPDTEIIEEQTEPTPVNSAKVSFAYKSYCYTGKAITPDNISGRDDITVKLGDEVLEKGVDYELEYENNISVGYRTASVKVKGIGEFTGEKEVFFTIKPARISITTITTQRDGITVNWDDDENAFGYQVLYSTDRTFTTGVHSTTVVGKNFVNLNNVPKAGEKYYIKMRAFITSDGTVQGVRYGSYSPLRSKTVKDDLRSASIPYCSYCYTGSAIKPEVTVKSYTGKVLTQGTDYSVSYKNNKAVGKAEITLKGKGSYQGTLTKSFIVKPARNELTELYQGGRARFTAEWKEDHSATGYQVLYSTDKDFETDVHSYTTKDTCVTFTRYTEAKKTYYVKVRSYLSANGTRYGSYSKVRKITTLDRNINTLKAQLKNAMSKYPGTWSAYVKNLRTNEIVSINEDRQYYAASLMKLFCMAATYEYIEAGEFTEDSVKSYLEYMITISADDPFNRLLLLMGKYSIHDWIIRNGYTGTYQCSGYGSGYRYSDTRISNGRNLTTAKDCVKFFESVYKGECVSKASSAKMLSLLKRQEVKYKLPQGVPKGVQTANKTGDVNDNAHDCMLVFLDGDPYIICVMSEIPGAAWSNAYHHKELSRLTYDFFANNK